MRYQLSDVGNFASGIDHSEGICEALDGSLYLGGEAGQIYHLSQDGILKEIAHSPGSGILLGLSIRSDGSLLICDPSERTIWAFDVKNDSWSVYCDQVDGLPLQTPNWGCFLPDGSYVFSDSGSWKAADGKLCRVRLDGTCELWSDKCNNFPNGLALSEDGRGIYVLESTPGRLLYVEILQDGSAGIPTVLCDFDAVPDGVTVAEGQNLIISCYRPDTIYSWSPVEGLKILVEDPEGTVVAAPTNTVLIGKNRSTLVWPNFGSWNVAKMETDFVGVPLLKF